MCQYWNLNFSSLLFSGNNLTLTVKETLKGMFLHECGCARTMRYLGDEKSKQCFKIASAAGLRFFFFSPVDVKDCVCVAE